MKVSTNLIAALAAGSWAGFEVHGFVKDPPSRKE